MDKTEVKARESARQKPAVETARKATPKTNGQPDRFTYALKAYTAERRATGWYVAKTWMQFAGEKPDWTGPFATIELACLAIGRRLATEIADRHTMMVGAHRIAADDPLYGLKPTTRLRQNGKAKPKA